MFVRHVCATFARKLLFLTLKNTTPIDMMYITALSHREISFLFSIVAPRLRGRTENLFILPHIIEIDGMTIVIK